MNLNSISRSAVGGSLKLARLPLDTTLRAVARAAPAVAGRAGVAADRVDAAVRELAGAVTGDERLRQDARRRRTAAGERGRAQELKAEADQRKERAAARTARQRADAEQQREAAAERAEQRRQDVERERAAKRHQVADAAKRRKAATDAAAARKREALQEREERLRLEQLQEEAQALEKQEEALTAQDEARRLGDAAGRVKAARKNS
jgi:hypothetical protein